VVHADRLVLDSLSVAPTNLLSQLSQCSFAYIWYNVLADAVYLVIFVRMV
jgi:hypothetical protein